MRAAIELADADGLAAVSLRKVGAALDAGPMRLYGYLSTKDELLDLMVDAVYGEITPPKPGDGWRIALRTIAHGTRDAALRHEWFTDLLGGRPSQGPNALVYMEATLSALDGQPGFTDIDAVLGAVGTVTAFTFGAIRGEITEKRAVLSSGMDEHEWQVASGPYMERMLATGRFPSLTKVVRDATHPDPVTVFDAGLGYVLDGIAAHLS